MAPTDGHDGVISRLSTYVERCMAAFEMPGVQIALSDKTDLIAALDFGYRNVDAGLPVERDTLFEFGSIGKSFTAICLLQMEAEGLVDLQQPIERYMPWWSVKSSFEPFAIHHVLSHTAGLISGTDWTPEQRFEVWSMRNTETLTAPGTRFHYSNAGYKALGLLVEHLAEKPYAEVVKERILDPLGMVNTSAVINHSVRSRLAVGYQDYYDDRPRVAGRGVSVAPFFETDSGDGCICASATDLAIYQRMLLNRGVYPGGRILTEEQFVAMTTPRDGTSDEDGTAYGYGLSVPGNGLPGTFGHSGGMVGYISNMVGDSETGLGAIAFTNSMNNVSRISEYALALLKAEATGDPLPDVPAIDSGSYEGIAGVYDGRSGQLEIRVSGGSVSIVRDGAEILATKTPFADDDLVDDRPGHDLFPYKFIRDDEKAVTEVVCGPDAWRPVGAETPPAQEPELARYAGQYRANNPWQTNFRLVARGDKLLRIYSSGDEEVLVRKGDWWGGASDEDGPEMFKIEVMVDGVVAEVRDALGSKWHRSFAP